MTNGKDVAPRQQSKQEVAETKQNSDDDNQQLDEELMHEVSELIAVPVGKSVLYHKIAETRNLPDNFGFNDDDEDEYEEEKCSQSEQNRRSAVKKFARTLQAIYYTCKFAKFETLSFVFRR